MPTLPFTVKNYGTLRELFKLLDVPFSETDYAANATIAQQLWVTEQRQLNVKYSDSLLLRVLPLGERMEMLSEIRPVIFGDEPPRLARMDSPGATRRAFVKRFLLRMKLEDEGREAGTFLVWGGQRLRDLKLGETLEELIKFVEEENPAVLDDPWFLAQLELDDENPDRYKRPLATEFEVLTLCAKVVFGSQLKLVRTEHIVGEKSSIEGVPARTVRYCVFARPDRPDIIILNGAAVERFNGRREPIEPQPTLASNAREVAAIFGFGEGQSFMVSNPHSLRLAYEAARVVGVPSFVIYGLPAPDAADELAKLRLAKMILGEVARLIHQEVKHGAV